MAASAAIGIIIDSLFDQARGPVESPLRGAIWLLLTLLSVTLMFRQHGHFSSLSVVLVCLPLAAGSHALHQQTYRRANLLSLVGPVEQSAVIDGVIELPVVLRRHPLSEWRERRGESPWQTQFELGVQQLRLGRLMQPCSGRVMVIVDGDCSERRPGDAVRLFGKVAAFSGPSNPGEVDRREFYRQCHLHARVECDSIDQVVWLDRRPSRSQYALSLIASVATQGRELLLRHMDPSNGSLAVALVLGQREFVDESTRDLLLVTGTAHLLSVSGLHLAIVVAIAGWIATIARFPLSAKIVWIVLICVLYTSLTGARPPVVRAAILVGTLMFALWMKRPGQPVNTLALAAMILMAINPQLLFNIGVQLSFLAVATLVSCGRQRDRRSDSIQATLQQEERLRLLVDRSRSRVVRLLHSFTGRLGQAIWFSACVTSLSMPLVWQSFHVVAPVSIATNVILGPLLVVALGSGIATVAIGFLFEPLMIVPAIVCDSSLGWMRRVIEIAASIPAGHFWLPAPPSWWVAIFYVVIVATMGLSRDRRSSLLRYGWIGVWTVIGWWMATSAPKLNQGSMEAIFVDVGHGTCVVLRFGPDEVWLYDCGRLGNDTFSSRGIDSVLWSLGVRRLSGVFLSHADSDHFNALPGVLRRFGVDAIYTPPELFEDSQRALKFVHDVVRERQLRIVELQRGSKLEVEGHQLTALHPPASRLAGTDNANSLVLRIDGPNRTMILPGDLEPPGTEHLIRADRPRPGGVLMAPHHGSLRMDAAAVLQWSRPSVTIVSGGRRATRPEVHEMLAETGSAVHVTSQVGAIRVVMHRDGQMEVRAWRQDPW